MKNVKIGDKVRVQGETWTVIAVDQWGYKFTLKGRRGIQSGIEITDLQTEVK